MPCFRDPDNLVYGKSEHGGMLFGGYEAEPASALDRRRPVGSRRDVAGARLRAVRAADGRRRPAVPVPRRRRGDPAGLSSGRDDAGCEPAARPDAGRPRVLGRCRPVAQRLRRRRRDRPSDGRLDHRRGSGRRRRPVPGLAVRRSISRSQLVRRPGPRGLRRLLPPALPIRRGRGRPAATAVGAPRPAPGHRRGVRGEGGLGAGGRPSSGPAMAAGRARPASLRLDASAVVRARRRGAPRGPRACRADRPVVVRQDRGPRTGRPRAPPARLRQRHRPTDRCRGLQPGARRARRDARRPDGDPVGRRRFPGRHRRGLGGRRPGLARRQPTGRRSRGRRPGRERGLGVPRAVGSAARTILGGCTDDPVDDAALPAPARRPDPGRPGPGPRLADQLRRRARLGALRGARLGDRRCGTAWSTPVVARASSRSATVRWRACGSRRATATTAPT